MELSEAIKERRSCRAFLPDPVSEEHIEAILEAAIWAPSPLNTQPWEFKVITNADLKEKVFSEGMRCKAWALEKSGWKWLNGYTMDFLKAAPVIIAVIGDPKKSGVDMFMEDGPTGYQHACAAAVQNMLLTAHSLGLGSLWFTFYDKAKMREILEVDQGKVPVALVCVGKPDGDSVPAGRKGLEKKVSYIG
ncbi:MAG: nitroreductase family protein [Deltaproteobacteria bacterium]|jgi:5,6-dimethylbenzimidazole synthase